MNWKRMTLTALLTAGLMTVPALAQDASTSSTTSTQATTDHNDTNSKTKKAMKKAGQKTEDTASAAKALMDVRGAWAGLQYSWAGLRTASDIGSSIYLPQSQCDDQNRPSCKCMQGLDFRIQTGKALTAQVGRNYVVEENV